MSTTTYKTTRKYKCPYCNFRSSRGELISHVEDKHQSLIPENYTAARVIYESINKKNYGTCMICGAKVYEWNEKINRYNNLCNNTRCRGAVRQIALERHIKVHNKPTLLNDPNQQEKMLANRKISGHYKFTDGGQITYTGKYEKNVLEFMDKVLGIESKDIQAPGPVLEYEYNGEKHMWITDIYYIPANLLIEVKDGGSNPNNRPMKSYREKQIAKEAMVTDLGKFNYLRLTNNDFSQLLSVLAEIKEENLESDSPSMKIRIHESYINEEVGGLPPQGPPEAYIVPYMANNVFAGFAYGDSEFDDTMFIVDDNRFIPIKEKVFYELYETGPRLFYSDNDIMIKVNNIHNKIIENAEVSNLYILEEFLGKDDVLTYNEIYTSNKFKYYDESREQNICSLIENAIYTESLYGRNESGAVQVVENVYINHSPIGYYAATYIFPHMSTGYYSNKKDLMESGLIEIMNSVYRG